MSLEARKIRLIMELRQCGIETAVLDAIERIPREHFVPDLFKDQAYQNRALPIGHGQTISQPLVVAEMTQLLRVTDRMKVLEVGTGSGYQAAVLSRLCRRVYTIERHRPLQMDALARFERLRLHNITARVGDGTRGWPEQAPFERILITAAASDVPTRMIEQLVDGGFIIMPLHTGRGEQKIVRVVRIDDVDYDVQEMSRVQFVPLVAGALPEDLEWAARRR